MATAPPNNFNIVLEPNSGGKHHDVFVESVRGGILIPIHGIKNITIHETSSDLCQISIEAYVGRVGKERSKPSVSEEVQRIGNVESGAVGSDIPADK